MRSFRCIATWLCGAFVLFAALHVHAAPAAGDDRAPATTTATQAENPTSIPASPTAPREQAPAPAGQAARENPESAPPQPNALPPGAPTSGEAKQVPPAPAVPRPRETAARPEPEASASPSNPRDPPTAAATAVATAPDASTQAPAPSRLLGRRLVPPFWFDFRYDTHRTRVLALPPLFVHRSPTAKHPEKYFHADLSLTFGWYARKTQKRRWFSILGLSAGVKSERKTAWASLPLLMAHRRIGDRYNFGQFPLVWAWGNRHVKNVFVVPFHYQQKTPDSFRAASAGLFWYGHKNLADDDVENDRRHFVAVPVFVGAQMGRKRLNVSPLYVSGWDKQVGVQHRTLFPLFHWQSREFGNRKGLWTPFWVRRTDRARGNDSWAVPPLLTFRSNTRETSLLSVTPLVWHAEDRLRERSSWVAGPVVLHRDPRQRIAVVAPLFWRFEDRRHRTASTLFVPFAWTRTTPARQSVWTLVGGGARGTDGWAFGIPPMLTFAGKSPTREHAVGLGLYWRFVRREHSDGVHAHHVLAPIGFVSKRGKALDVGFLPGLVFAGSRATRKYQMVTPLLWHVRDRDPANAHDTWVAGPLWARKVPTGFHAGLFPLGAIGSTKTRGYAVLPPLLFGHVRDADSSLTVSPLFAHARGPEGRTIGVLNLAWDVRRKQQRDTVVFPLYYRRARGQHALTLTPLGGGWKTPEKTTWVAALAYGTHGKARSGFGVLPLLFHQSKRLEGGGRAQHTVLFPLFLRRRTPTDDMDVWTPLVWRSHVRTGLPRKGLAIVPLYFRQRQPRGVDVDASFAFFYSRNRTRHTHTLIAGPFFHRLSRTELHTGFAPLYWWKDSETKRLLVALPIITHIRDKMERSHTTVAVPLWFDRQRPNGSRTWMAFPFVLSVKRLHNFTRLSIAPPMFVDVFRLSRNYRFTGALPLWFRYEKCGFQATDDPKCRYRVSGSFPLFLYGKDGRGRRTHGALGLYVYDRDPEGYKFYTLPFGMNVRPGKTLAWYLFPLYVKTTQTHKRALLFPLYYRRAHRTEDISTTVIAPPLYIGQRNKDKRWFQASLLVWQFREPQKVATTVLPPLFFHSHAFAQRKLTWVLPLFLRDDNIGKNEAWTVAFPALYVQRRRQDDLDFVQFPLVWHIERGQRSGTMGAFVWWDFRGNGNITQVVPGLFTRRATAKHDTKVLGPGLAWWSRGKGSDADDRHWRVLLGLFGGGREDGRRYVSILGMRIRGRVVGKQVKVQQARGKRAKASRRLTRQAPAKRSRAQ